MADETIVVLLIEDNSGDARLIREVLEEDRAARIKLIHVTDLKTGLERLAEGGIDVVLLDLSLPDSRGIDTFNQAHTHSPRVPIVVLTGHNDDVLASATLRAGGQDFLSKGVSNLCALHQSIRHAIARKRVEQSNRALDMIDDASPVDERFLAIVCEEFRTPLAQVLVTLSGMTAEHTMGAECRSNVMMIRRLVELQASLVDDLLNFAGIGTRAAAFQPTDSQAALEHAVAKLRPSIDETHAVVDHGALPSLLADPDQMGLLFQYLIANAIRYRGYRPPQIQIASQRQGPDWVFSVRDNGIGFDPAHAERIFIIFQRLHGQDPYPGTGIGLACCKKIVERHGGRIWAESDPGRGSQFFFRIPASANGRS